MKPSPLLAAVLCGCVFELDRLAGGEDFPNTLAPLGKAAAGGISSHAEWDQFQDLQSPPPLIPTDTVGVPVFKAAAEIPVPLGKWAGAVALGDTVTWDFRDTASGLIRRYFTRDALLQEQRDTLIFRWHAAFDTAALALAGELLLEARGWRLTRLPYKLQPFRFLNLDSAGPVDQGDYGLVLIAADSTLRIQHTRVWAGADGDLDSAADNVVVEYEFLRLRPGPPPDTLVWIRAVDDDGDGRLWGIGDSGNVELRSRYRNPPFKPQAERLAQTLLLRLYARGDSSMPLAYLETRLLRDGTSAAFSARGIRSDSLLRPGDTALVAFDQTPPAGADLAEGRARFLVLLGPTPWLFSGNALLRFDLWRRWRNGLIREMSLAFAPDSAVLSGHRDLGGTFSLSARYEDGGTGDATGTFDGADIRATLDELRSGARKSFRLRYDVNGKVLERDSIPSPLAPLHP